MQNTLGFSLKDQLSKEQDVALYRAYSHSLKKNVLVKQIVDEHHAYQGYSILKHEYELICGLELEGILKPIDAQTIDHQYVVLFEDVDAIPLSSYLNKQPLDRLLFLKAAKNLATTVSKVHAEGIIHKEISPQSILINSETGKTYLSNFTAASNLRDLTQVQMEPKIPKGSISYISPELTGWMNRAVDFRTDLYSLGVTFYQMVTGRLPFEMDDPMELIHAHIARKPADPREINPQVDSVIASIILKLLEKTTERRYQSAFALSNDLNTCLTKLVAQGEIVPFPLGKHDIYDRFQVPHRLYGREAQVEDLMASFERAGGGEAELMLVAGYSGIGKSALVNEIRKPIIQRRGFFIAGKFDQLQRDIPFRAIILAFQDLVRQLLMLNKKQLNRWQDKIKTALGKNAAVITEVIPEVELIIGRQSPVISLGAMETQNRFNLVFGAFIQLFAKKEHPLVIFIDDLQWADSATLNFIKILLTSREYKYLLLLGAYRDNEVDPTHPFLIAVEEIKRSHACVHTITLEVLSYDHLCQMLSESLCTDRERVATLAELLIEKTGGNPFFIIQFLLMLYDEKLLYMNFKVRQWQWDIAEIKGQDFTDNVVDLMVKKVRKLPVPTQNLLRLAACIGAKFNLKTLSIISERSLTDVARDLWPAVNEGLLQTVDENHKLIVNMEALEKDLEIYPEAIDRFLHDRVQQAAYLLIDEDQQQEVHLNIGRELLNDVSSEYLEDNIFKIVPHLNKGVDLIESKNERLYLAQLNLQAAIKAKNSSAWQPALHYLKTGISLLPDTIWQENEHLAYKLYRENMDCHFCDGRSEEGDNLYKELMAKPISESEKIELSNIAVINYSTNPEHMEDAIDIGLKSLSLLGMYLDKHPSEETIGKSIEKAAQLVADRSIDSLFDLPQMTDERAKQLVDTIAVLGPSTYVSGSPLLITSNMEMLLTIVEFGNCSLSSYCYAYQGVINTILGNYSVAFDYAKLALKVFHADPNPAISGRVHMMYNNFGGQWGDSLQNTTAVRTKGFQKAMEIGDLHWGIYNYIYGFPCEVITAESSSELLGRYNKIVKLGSKLHPLDYMAVSMQRNVLLNLRGEIEDRDCISSELNEVVEISKGYGINITLLLSMHACQALVSFLNGDFESIVKISRSEQCSTWKKPNQGLYSTIFFMFLESLAIMRDTTVYDKETRIELDHRVADTIKQSEVWANIVPQTYDCMRLMLLAEKNSREGIHKNTLSYYEQAIQLSSDSRFILFEGIANELCSDYWQSRGKTKIADLYLAKAITAFDGWGAERKVEELKQQSNRQVGLLRQSTMVESDTPDLDVVISVLQKISRTTVLDELIKASLTSCLEHCSLLRAMFLLNIDGELIVQADAQSEPAQQIDWMHRPMRLDKSLPIDLITEAVESRNEITPLQVSYVYPYFNRTNYLLSSI